MINVIAALGLNLLVGNSGQTSLCHSSLMAIGAYVATLVTLHMSVPFWAAIPVGAATTGSFGALLALPVSKLKGIYLALATLGFLQIVQIVLSKQMRRSP
jgi:branched-chain amino acid transport system permease protein